MKVIITEQARLNLKGIGDFIRPRNPARAGSFVDELTARCEELGSLPRAYPLVPRYEHFNIRRRLHGDYLIFYRIGDETLDVIHICHCSQVYEAGLFCKT